MPTTTLKPLRAGCCRPLLADARPRAARAATTRATPPDAGDPLPSDLAGFLSPPRALDLLDRDLAALDRQVRESAKALDRAISESASSSPAPREGGRTFSERTLPGGGRAWSREERSERTGPGGGYSRSYRSETVMVWGVDSQPRMAPPPAAAPSLLSPAVVVAALVAGAYASVAAAFARRFERATTYKPASKRILVLLWPFLALASRDFRGQLREALASPDEVEGEGVKKPGPQAGPAVPADLPPPRLPTGPAQTGGGRTTADSSMYRPDRWQG